MKKIGKFLFVEQCFTDTEETKPYVIHIDAIDSIIGISLERAKKLCRTVPGKRVEVNPPIEIISKLNTDKLFEELEEYEIEVSISIPSK